MTVNKKSLDAARMNPQELYFLGLARDSTVIDYRAGQVLFYSGHKPCGVIVILSGRVMLTHTKDKRQQKVAQDLIPIGFDLIANDEPYPYTAQVIDDCKILFISKGAIKKLQEELLKSNSYTEVRHG